MANLAAIEAEAHACRRCPLAATRTKVVFGAGDPKADLVFVGEAPGAEEDKQGLPFVGRSGKLLDRLLAEEVGLGRDDVYIANVLRCRPPGNRDPRPEEVESCRPFLERTLDAIDPKVIVTLGNFATRLLLDTKDGITKVRGRTYSYNGRTLVPTFHPSAVLQGGGGDTLARMRADLVRAKQVMRGGPAEVAS